MKDTSSPYETPRCIHSNSQLEEGSIQYTRVHTKLQQTEAQRSKCVCVGGESFPHCIPYVNIVGVKFRPAKYRVTTTDNEGNTEIRDLPGLELARFVRNARQDLWQCSYRHSLQELGATW
jgi:hypothetical protein